MSDTRYPTRMHEVLGVETGEIFTINEDDYGFYHTLDCDGQIVFTDPEDAEEYRITADMVTSAINHGITRRLRLTQEQVRLLQAAFDFGIRYLAKDQDGELKGYGEKPYKVDNEWFNQPGGTALFLGLRNDTLKFLVSWDDPAPLDIVQVLRQNGEEVEG